MKSKELKRRYRSMHYFWDKLYNSTWFHMRASGKEEHRLIAIEVEQMLLEVQRKINSAYGPMIGEAEMYEIRIGEKE